MKCVSGRHSFSTRRTSIDLTSKSSWHAHPARDSRARRPCHFYLRGLLLMIRKTFLMRLKPGCQFGFADLQTLFLCKADSMRLFRYALLVMLATSNANFDV